MAANIPAQPMVQLHRTDGLMNGTFTVNWWRAPERKKPVQLLKTQTKDKFLFSLACLWNYVKYTIFPLQCYF